jgi:hypothetical protein
MPVVVPLLGVGASVETDGLPPDPVTPLHEQKGKPLRCPSCGRGSLQLVGERPHPLYGVLGMTEIILWCDAPDCGKVVVV